MPNFDGTGPAAPFDGCEGRGRRAGRGRCSGGNGQGRGQGMGQGGRQRMRNRRGDGPCLMHGKEGAALIKEEISQAKAYLETLEQRLREMEASA